MTGSSFKLATPIFYNSENAILEWKTLKQPNWRSGCSISVLLLESSFVMNESVHQLSPSCTDSWKRTSDCLIVGGFKIV